MSALGYNTCRLDMAYTVMAYTVMAYIVMAYIVMAYIRLSARSLDHRAPEGTTDDGLNGALCQLSVITY